MRITPEIRAKILNGTREERVYLCGHIFLAFALYYFPDYFTFPIAPFHKDFADDCERMGKNELREAVWVGFKECGKTSFAKIFTIWLIAYKKRRFINYDSYDKSNAEAALFDIISELQTNQRLIADFGQLFTEQRGEDEKKLKKVTSFITTNDIKVEAFSTGQSTRGRLYKSFRPDHYTLDDCENSQTILSAPVSQKIIAHVNELRSGLAAEASVLYLGNYLSDQGVVQYFLDTVQRSGGSARFVPVVQNGVPTWGDKYCLKDADKGTSKKISLETKKRELGDLVYETEMMLNPYSSGDLVFTRPKIERLLSEPEQPYEDKAGFRVWDTYNPKHRYAIGADTAKGNGGDSNTAVLIDFSSKPARQIGSFASNQMPPDVFAHELKREADMFGECLLAPEVNNTGYATITELKHIYPIDKIFRPRNGSQDVNVKERVANTLGWETNKATKPEMIFQLKSAIEDGDLRVEDHRILEEAKAFRRNELYELAVSPLATRHFDLLMACAIAWAMRPYAEVSKPVSTYRQAPPHVSEFEAPIGEDMRFFPSQPDIQRVDAPELPGYVRGEYE